MAGVGRRELLAVAFLGSTLFALRPGSAQPVLDRALAGAQLATQEGCVILKVNFNVRIRYASHFPVERGNELRIAVNLIDRNQADALVSPTPRREAITLPDGERAGIMAIDFETQHLTQPVLRIVFDRALDYQVAPSSDTQSIVVALPGAKRLARCQPIYPGGASPIRDMRDAGADAAVRPNDRSAGAISDPDLRSAAAWMDEGRAALKHNNFGTAIQLFAKVLKYPENQYSAEARELLGLARQKGGQLDQARAVYEEFLRRYPSGEQSERVRQRLAGIVTAIGGQRAPLQAADGLPDGTLPIGKFAQTRATNWTFVASVSSF
jgi:hypothetical protein